MNTNTQKNRANAVELSAFDKKVISTAKMNGLRPLRLRCRYGFNVWRISYGDALTRDFIAAAFGLLRGANISESRRVSHYIGDCSGYFDITAAEARLQFTALFDAAPIAIA